MELESKAHALAEKALKRSAERKSSVRNASPQVADFINEVKSTFGLAFVLVEKDGKELYRAGKEDPPKDYWDGQLRPAKDVKQWQR